MCFVFKSKNFTNEIKNYASYKDEDIIKIDFKWELDGKMHRLNKPAELCFCHSFKK